MTTLPLTEHKRNVAKAWLDGKIIQMRFQSEWRDVSFETYLSFSDPDDTYRIKPTPTRRFWRPEEIPVGWQIREVNNKFHFGLIQYGEDDVVYLTTSRMIDSCNFMHYEVAPPGPANAVQWQPAGVEE